jgi:ligand-binding sensor domain-containing protein
MLKKMFVIGIFSLVFVLSGSEEAKAQVQANGQWTTYTTSDGLPFNEVGAVAFGPGGDLWCSLVHPGGDGGIAHFDGNTWEHYTSEDGLGNDFTIWSEHTLTVSPENILWVATFGGGVSRFDGETWKTYTTFDGLLSDQLTGVSVAPDGTVWCIHPVLDFAISHFNGESWTGLTSEDLGIDSSHMMCIAFETDGTLWAGGSHVLRYKDESWTDFSTETGLEGALYMDIGPDDKVWIGFEGSGVSCYDSNTWTHYSLADIGTKESGGLMPLAVDHDNVLWVGINDDGVYKYDGESWTRFVSEGAPALDFVYSITVGPDSTIWFGTEYGLFNYDEKASLINMSHKKENKITVYPNPFADWIMIKGNRNLDACASVFNITGNILFEESCKGKNEFLINTANLPKGIYFVQIASKENTTAYKIIK